MSKGPGVVERKIAELFRKSGIEGDDRTFTVAELCRDVFGCDTPTRAQRVSVVRAARTAMRRAEAASRRRHDLQREAWTAAEAKFGKPPRGCLEYVRSPFKKFIDEHPATQAASRVAYYDLELWGWRATALKDGSLVFHHYMRPVRVWAVEITREGLVWGKDSRYPLGTSNVPPGSSGRKIFSLIDALQSSLVYGSLGMAFFPPCCSTSPRRTVDR
jgi:hypothetical protein